LDIVINKDTSVKKGAASVIEAGEKEIGSKLAGTGLRGQKTRAKIIVQRPLLSKSAAWPGASPNRHRGVKTKKREVGVAPLAKRSTTNYDY